MYPQIESISSIIIVNNTAVSMSKSSLRKLLLEPNDYRQLLLLNRENTERTIT